MRAAQLQTSSVAEKSTSDCSIKRPQHANSRQTQSDEGPMETGRNFKKKKKVFTGLDTEKHFNKTLKLLATA